MSVEENKVAVRRFIEALDTDDLAALDDVCSPGVAQDWSDGINDGPFSEHHLTITDLVAEGDKVVVVLATQSIHSGEWEGIPSTGKRLTNQGAVLLRLEGDKIVEVMTFFDFLTLAKQLGATVTPPAQASSKVPE